MGKLSILMVTCFGCSSTPSYHKVKITVKDGWTGKPIPAAEVSVQYSPARTDKNAPQTLKTKTDANGEVVVSIAACESWGTGITLYAAGKVCHPSNRDLREGVTRMAAPWTWASDRVLVTVTPLEGPGQPKPEDEARFAALVKEQERSDTEYHEKKLETWRDTTEPLDALVVSISDPSIDIAGEWSTFFDHGSELTITRTRQGEYSFGLFTHGSLGRWRLTRTGTYNRGKVVLSKGVEEYGSGPYDMLYAVRIGQREYLLQKAYLLYWKSSYSKQPGAEWKTFLDHFAFKRVPKRTSPTSGTKPSSRPSAQTRRSQ